MPGKADPMERSSGILLPLFSLPSPYGIGTMGLAAYDFADLLHAAGQRYWQMLPLGPTSVFPPMRAIPISLIWIC